MRLDSGENAAIVSWYAENSSATAATTASAAPPSRRCRPCSWNSVAGAPSPAPTSARSTGASLTSRSPATPRLLHHPGVAVVLLRAGMQRHRHPGERVLLLDRLARRMRRDQRRQVLPHRLGELVDGVGRHALVGDEEVLD